jgi:hypothetical protein
MFEPKNDLIYDLDELLVFPMFTRAMLYGDFDQARLWEDLPPEQLREQSRVLSDYVTVHGGPRVNYNTMSPIMMEGALRAVKNNANNAREAAEIFVDMRNRLADVRGGGGSIQQFTQLTEAGVILPTEAGALSQLLPFDNKSTEFTITSRGNYKGVVKTLQYRVRVGQDTFPIDVQRPDTYGRRDANARGLLSKHDGRYIFDPTVTVISMIEK